MPPSLPERAVRRIAHAACGLLAAMLASRALLWWPENPGLAFLRNLPRFAYADIAIWAATVLPFLVLVLLLRGRWRLRMATLYAAFAFAQAALAGINVTAVFWLAGPITFQWLTYSDFAMSDTSRIALAGVIDAASVGALVLSVAAFAGGWLLARVWFVLAERRGFGRAALGLPMLLGVGLTLDAARFGDPGVFLRGRMSNPLAELVRTAWASRRFEFEAALPGDDERYYRAAPAASSTRPSGGARPDVLLIVLESVGELDLAGAGPLPTLGALSARGTRFDTAYVTTGSSTRSAFTLVSGRYPLFGFRQETRTLRDWPMTSLPALLRAAGYETTMMMGGDLDFSDVRGFVERRGFDHLADMQTIACGNTVRLDNKRWQHVGYISDSCLFDHFLAVDSARSAPGTPRFAVLWNTSTHFPYTPAGPGLADPRARYRAAVRQADAQIGRVLAHLRAAGRLDSTLVIVIGDHGEAFFEHGNFSHGSTLFEEELRIPMIMVWPGHIAAGRHERRLAHLVDLAPTIAGLLGLPVAPGWQEIDLFGPVVRPRAYFYATQRDFLIGYREGGRKYVLDAGRDRLVRYDLDRDPLERVPMMPTSAEAAMVRGRLAGWAGYNSRLYRR